jgi:predicted PolB exonuclease-like 3'-5' exonuclease
MLMGIAGARMSRRGMAVVEPAHSIFLEATAMSTGDNFPRIATDNPPAFLVFDTESVPDGKLLRLVKYADLGLSDEEAIAKAQAEARERSRDQSDFLPVTFQLPVAVCVLRVGTDFQIQGLTCLDAPQFRTREIVQSFWRGLAHYQRAKLVTFNGRSFDLPLMELAAFRYGCCALEYFQRSRHRYSGHLDLCDFLSNYGGCRMTGGLNLLSKMLGKPGKMEISGEQVYFLHCAGKIQDINDYCMFDTLDTYFVFLRTRVLTGEFELDRERELVDRARAWVMEKSTSLPALRRYLDNWGDWQAWP